MVITEAAYPAFKANLEAIGVTGLPLVTEIVWTAPLPCTFGGAINVKKNTVASSTITVP